MIDTNILLSAMLFPGEHMDALMRKASVENHLVISSYVLDELFDVIRRKFSSQEGAADRFLQRIPYELVYTPKQPEPGLFDIRDPDDYAVMNLHRLLQFYNVDFIMINADILLFIHECRYFKKVF
jgi:predicted nucleic acid-binding protein